MSVWIQSGWKVTVEMQGGGEGIYSVTAAAMWILAAIRVHELLTNTDSVLAVSTLTPVVTGKTKVNRRDGGLETYNPGWCREYEITAKIHATHQLRCSSCKCFTLHCHAHWPLGTSRKFTVPRTLHWVYIRAVLGLSMGSL